MTYSIVARDRETGALGVAVQSHWFSVGPLVPWAEPGVGAVATQANVEVAYGPRALALLRAGRSAPEALAELLGADEHAAVRQVAVVDAAGRVAVHTGDGCMPFAGHVTGDEFTCQANLMATAGVWPAMAAAFAGAQGPLARRLLAALDAGEAAGGDVRGRQSAAIVVVAAGGEPWRRQVDLRVEDHPEPLAELRRLLLLRDAYDLAGDGDRLTGEGRLAEAADQYVAAHAAAPDSTELAFWAGLSLVARQDAERGLALVRRAVAAHPGWAALLDRLDPEAAPGVEETRRLLGGSG
ncbi:MAG: DUF1028 domain-containing protein [Chloroflexi bacterium]|nr:MAG: DUF1028 domain-containing protein [Chloroflexota bacterium]